MLVAIAAMSTRAFAWGAPDWVKAVAKEQVPSYSDASAGVVLLDDVTTTVTSAGEIRTRVRRAIRVLNSAGRDLATVSIPFDPDRRILDLHAWTITASGEEYPLKDRDAAEIAAGDGQLYGDEKIKVLTLAAPEPGNTLAWEYERRERPYELQAVWAFQWELPVRTSRYRLLLPEGWTFDEHWARAPRKEPQSAAGQTLWELNDIAPVKPAPSRPAFASLAGRMSINFIPPQEQHAGKIHRTWTDVGKWYATLVGTRRDPTPAIRAKAAQLVDGRKTMRDKIAALATFAQNDVRYVAIEIGIGGIQPHPADDILSNHYGDCKDKATLLASMLRAIDVDSYYVLLSTNRGVVDREFPSTASFNHAVIAIHLPDDVKDPSLRAIVTHPRLGRLLLFDPTNESVPFGDVPAYLQQTTVFLATADGGEAVELPMRPADENRSLVTGKLSIDATGTLEGDVRIILTGLQAAYYRGEWRAKSEKDRNAGIQADVARDFGEHRLDDLEIEGVDAREGPVTVKFRISAKSFAKKAGSLVLVRPRVVGRVVGTLLDLKDRIYAYDTGGPSVDVSDIDVKLPPGFEVDELPAPVHIAQAGLKYDSASKVEGDLLKYHREYRVERFTVAVEELPLLNATFTKILADERASAVLKAR